MLSHEVAKKYSGALFLSLKERNLIDAAYEQFEDLQKLITKDKSLLKFLSTPQVLDENKQALIRKVFSGRIEQLFVEFLVVLVEKHRANFLPGIIDELKRSIEAEKGIGRATILSALPLTEVEKQQLTKKLADRMKLKIIIDEKVDPSILGGIIIILHNEIIDGSVAHGLSLLEEQLNKVRVH